MIKTSICEASETLIYKMLKNNIISIIDYNYMLRLYLINMNKPLVD